jgi:hypothetical protein
MNVTAADWAVLLGIVLALLALDLLLATLRRMLSASARPRCGRCSSSRWQRSSAWSSRS